MSIVKHLHSNDEGQNDLNVKLFDVRHSNLECQNDTNVGQIQKKFKLKIKMKVKVIVR